MISRLKRRFEKVKQVYLIVTDHHRLTVGHPALIYVGH
jgi:hypothetical protein